MIQHCYSYGNLAVFNRGVVSVESTTFEVNVAVNGAGILVEAGSVIVGIDDCEFSGNTAANNGSAIMLNGGGITTTITNSEFRMNTAGVGGMFDCQSQIPKWADRP